MNITPLPKTGWSESDAGPIMCLGYPFPSPSLITQPFLWLCERERGEVEMTNDWRGKATVKKSERARKRKEMVYGSSRNY